jgi:hypothetical protein
MNNNMDLPSRSKLSKKNEIKTFPPLFSIFPAHHTDRVVNSLCTLLQEDEGAIYIRIIVATSVGDITMPIAYGDHNNNKQMR